MAKRKKKGARPMYLDDGPGPHVAKKKKAAKKKK
jgi:hypothetical protein